MSSPIKRRALAPVDGNLPTPAKTPVKPVDEAQSVSGTAAAAACSSSPIKPRGLQMTPPASSSPRKRAATPDDSPRKRACPVRIPGYRPNQLPGYHASSIEYTRQC